MALSHIYCIKLSFDTFDVISVGLPLYYKSFKYCACQHYQSRDDTDAQRSDCLRSGRYTLALALACAATLALALACAAALLLRALLLHEQQILLSLEPLQLLPEMLLHDQLPRLSHALLLLLFCY